MEGASCPNGTVCEIRDCFHTTLLNYDQIIHAMIVNFQLVTQAEVWVVAREYEYAAGPRVWWYFVIMTIVGYVLRIVYAMVLGNKYFLITFVGYYSKGEEVNDRVGQGVAGKWGGLAGRWWCLGGDNHVLKERGVSSRDINFFFRARTSFT